MERNIDIREILTRHSGDVPVDVNGLARDLGLTVITDHAMPEDVAGKIVRDPRNSPAGFTIFINGRDNPRRRRFTLAHEAAHYILHRDLIGDGLIDSAFYRSKLSDIYERQANRLAADILMPSTAVRNFYEAGIIESEALAQRFNVSGQAMAIRMAELRLINPPMRQLA